MNIIEFKERVRQISEYIYDRVSTEVEMHKDNDDKYYYDAHFLCKTTDNDSCSNDFLWHFGDNELSIKEKTPNRKKSWISVFINKNRLYFFKHTYCPEIARTIYQDLKITINPESIDINDNSDMVYRYNDDERICPEGFMKDALNYFEDLLRINEITYDKEVTHYESNLTSDLSTMYDDYMKKMTRIELRQSKKEYYPEAEVAAEWIGDKILSNKDYKVSKEKIAKLKKALKTKITMYLRNGHKNYYFDNDDGEVEAVAKEFNIDSRAFPPASVGIEFGRVFVAYDANSQDEDKILYDTRTNELNNVKHLYDQLKVIDVKNNRYKVINTSPEYFDSLDSAVRKRLSAKNN